MTSLVKKRQKKEEFITFYQKLSTRLESIESEISSLRRQIADLPSGKLICTRNQNRYKWYLSDGHSHTYLPKAERITAEQLARKKYLTCRLHDLEHEKYAISLYLRHYKSNVFQTEKLLTEPSGFQELLTPHFRSIPQDLLDWSNAPYEHNTKYPEQLTHKTLSGHYVRSKSEALIDFFLYTNQIPFRYECALPLGTGIIYPDFTIRHLHTGNLIYWEHFGLMDDPLYSQNAASKLQLYIANGIIPSIQLITTYETKKNPLTTDTIDMLVRHYFL